MPTPNTETAAPAKPGPWTQYAAGPWAKFRPAAGAKVTKPLKLNHLQETELKAGPRPEGMDDEFLTALATSAAAGIDPDKPSTAVLAPLTMAGNFARAAASDLGATLSGHPEYGGNLFALARNEPLPADSIINEITAQHPKTATAAKIGAGAAATLPYLALGQPEGIAGRLMAAGFSAGMVKEARDAADELGTEMGKNPEDRDEKKITDSLASIAQATVFAPLAGKHAIGDSVEARIAPKGYVIRKLAKQLTDSPIDFKRFLETRVLPTPQVRQIETEAPAKPGSPAPKPPAEPPKGKVDKTVKPPESEKSNEPEPGHPGPSAPNVDVRKPAGAGPSVGPVGRAGGTPGSKEPSGAEAGERPAGPGNDERQRVGGGEPLPAGPAGRPGEPGTPAGPGALPGTTGNPPPPATSGEVGVNHVLPRDQDWIPVGDKAKARANLEAVRLLKQLEAEKRLPTEPERQVLARYTGWGGLQAVFDEGKAAYRQHPPRNPTQSQEFVNWEKNWGQLYDEVKRELTPKEHQAAGASILNAHYTSRDVINSVWDAVRRLGFTGGQALEPAAGVGNFIGLTPADLRGRTAWTAAELDDISGRLLTKLYPHARVHRGGFETARVSPNSQDLVISNVPFAKEGPRDKRYPKFSLHNYFFARALDLVKPAGIVAAITSDSTMDNAASREAREYFADKADLVGAMRLPNTAFKKNAGTEVTTDVLFFRKKDGRAAPMPAEPFGRTVGAQTKGGEPLEINEYFARHPEMMLGQMSLEGTMYGPDQQALLPTPGAELSAQLAEAVAKLPQNVMGSIAPAAASEQVASPEFKAGQLALSPQGEPRLVQPDGTLEKPEWAAKPKKVEQAKRYLKVRDSGLKIIELQNNPNATDADVAAGRVGLNVEYDEYVKRHGPLNGRGSAYLDDDVDFPAALALEDDFTTLEKQPDGSIKRVSVWQKSKIFSERTIVPRRAPEQVDTVPDALQVSLNFQGVVDPDYISKLTRRAADQVKAELESTGQAFENPGTGLWESRAEYLSGFVKDKLKAAQLAAESDPRYVKHVTELTAIQPPVIPIENIGIRLGATWVPPEVVADFISRTLGVDADVTYTPETGTWHVQPKAGWAGERNVTTYGIHGWKGHELIEQSLNLKGAVVTRTVPKEGGGTTDVKDGPATLQAQEKQQQLADLYKTWIKQDPAQSKHLQDLYNDQFNGVTAPKFDAPAWAHYPGASEAVRLRDHQKAVVSRMVQDSTLLAHAVGTGKTYAMATAAMEMRRLGTARKPMIVVQNATLEQFARSFKKLYPAARLLAPNERQRDSVNRNKTMTRIATGDWDAVIVPQSFVNMLPDDPAREEKMISDRIAELEDAKIKYARDAGKKSPKAKDLERALKRLQERLQDLAGRKKDKGLTFEQLGVDALFVDEAHAYKKLEFFTQMDNVKGLDRSASQRGWSMFMKVRHVQEKNDGRNVIFATGTPVSNTLAEAWNMMRYLRPDVLEKYGMENFDSFAANFGDTTTEPEMTAGGTWKAVTRFARFTNGPELIAAWRTVADVVTPEEVNLPGLPALKTGRPIVHTIPQTKALANYVDFLRSELQRFEKMSGGEKRKNSHIPLVVFGLAKKATLDMRMIDPESKEEPDSKINVAARAIKQLFDDHTPVKGTQLVFSDAYQDDPDKPRFNLYQALRQKLIDLGVPENQIAIVTSDLKGLKRDDLFRKVSEGDMRIVLGSTERMGVGVNVQEKLVGLHHLDAPPRPMDIEQRNGRILRQGNTNPEVEIHVYGVENTLDAAMYQKLATKQRFINQILRGDVQGRNFEDAANEVSLTYQEQMAAFSGDPRAMERVVLENKVRQLSSSQSGHAEQVRKGRERMADLVNRVIPYRQNEIKAAQRRAGEFAEAFPKDGDYTVEIGGRTISGKKEVAEALTPAFRQAMDAVVKDAADKTIYGSHSLPAGSFKLNGKTVTLTAKVIAAEKGVINPDSAWIKWEFEDGGESGQSTTGPGFLHSVSAAVERIARAVRTGEQNLAGDERDLRELTSFVETPWDKSAELKQAQDRLTALDAELQSEAKTKDAETPPAEDAGEGDEQTHEMLGGQALRTALAPAVRDLKAARAVLAPTAAGDAARLTGNVLRQLRAEQRLELDRAEAAVRKMRKSFDRTPPARNWKYDPTLPLPRNYAFIDAMQTGNFGMFSPADQSYAQMAKEVIDHWTDRLAAETPEVVNNWMQNYFPQYWDQPEKAKSLFNAALARRPLEGNKSFLKKRIHELFTDGLAAGLKPADSNPADFLLRKKAETEQFIFGRRFQEIMRAGGQMKFRFWSRSMPGYRAPKDAAFQAWAPPFVTVKEAYDAGLRGATLDLLQKLKIPFARSTAIGSKGWGFEKETKGKPGSESITTKFGGPDFAIWHELGHALDNRYPDLRVRLTATEDLNEELRSLADLRFERIANPSKNFKRYVRTMPEKAAVALQAYMHAPDRMKQVAPNAYQALSDFIQAHPELHDINNIKPGLTVGVGEAVQKLPGLVKLGEWVLPDAAAQVVDNFLSAGAQHHAWFRGVREGLNVMNGIQLVGGFHLGFVTGEAPINKVALALREASLGQFTLAAKSIASAPAAAITNIVAGRRIIRDAMKDETARQYPEQVKQMLAAGGRFRQDPLWRTQYTRRFTRALSQAWVQLQEPGLQKGYALSEMAKAALNLPPSIIEQAMRPVMEYFVPAQKVGAAVYMMGHEQIARPGMNDDEAREAFGRVWDSIDNRMGNMTYDNQMMNKAVKNALQVTFRSFGWQEGKYFELAGGVSDLVKLGWNTGRGKWTGLSHRSTYLFALPAMMAMGCTVATYMLTGQAPASIEDLFTVRTGAKDQNGNWVRINPPSYMRDVLGYLKHPLDTVGHSLNPMFSMLYDLWNNKDFYNTVIASPDESWARKQLDRLEFVGEQFKPFFVEQAQHVDKDTGSIPQKLGAFFGFTPYPERNGLTPAQELAGTIMRGNLPPMSKDQARHAQLVHQLVLDMKNGQVNGEGELEQRERAAGVHRKSDDTALRERIAWTPLQYQLYKMPLNEPGSGQDAMSVWALMNHGERVSSAWIYREKINRAVNSGRLDAAIARKLWAPIAPYYREAKLAPAGETSALGKYNGRPIQENNPVGR